MARDWGRVWTAGKASDERDEKGVDQNSIPRDTDEWTTFVPAGEYRATQKLHGFATPRRYGPFVDSFLIVDPDVVQSHNLSRLPHVRTFIEAEGVVVERGAPYYGDPNQPGTVVKMAPGFGRTMTAAELLAYVRNSPQRRQYEAELKCAAALRASRRASTVLDTYAVILPQRLVDEELGDFLEDIHRRAAEGQSETKIYFRVAAAMFWTGCNALGYITANLFGRKKGA